MEMAAAPRRVYLDNLKVLLVTGVIVGHVCITYGDIGSWAYREPSRNKAFLIPAGLFVVLGSMFAMGLFFFIAGLFTPRALSRKGAFGFLSDRLRRLGLPFVVFLLIVFPVVKWAGDRRERSLGWHLQAQLRALDPGPLWFVLVLLLFSTAYVAWRIFRPWRGMSRPWRRSVIAGLAGGIAAGTFIVRQWFPIDSHQIFELHVWQWPQCLGLFGFGIVCAENGWLDPVPHRLRRASGFAALGGGAVLLAALVAGGDSLDPFGGGMTWPAALVAGCEGILSVSFAIWLIGRFQCRWDKAGSLARGMGKAAFGAYVLQAPVVVAMARLAEPLPVPPEVKFLLVAPAAVAGSFGLAWGLARVRGIKRFQ